MENIISFIKKYANLFIFILISLTWIKSCGIKRECSNTKKQIIELTKKLEKNDSILSISLDKINHKLDSTLISNSAVVNSNNATKNALNNQKQQQVIVKVLQDK